MLIYVADQDKPGLHEDAAQCRESKVVLSTHQVIRQNMQQCDFFLLIIIYVNFLIWSWWEVYEVVIGVIVVVNLGPVFTS